MKRLKYSITLVCVILLIYLLNKNNLIKGFSPTEIRDYVLSFEVYAPLIYIILFTIVPLTLFPDSILAIAGGMIFGIANGAIYTMIGAVCGASLSFYLSRTFGQTLLKSLLSKHPNLSTEKFKSKGFLFILILRLIPLIPFDIISYSAGLSEIKYKDFILATVLGIIPGVLVFTNIGDKSIDIGSDAFYVSLALLIGLISITVLIKRKISIRQMTSEN